MNEGRVFWKSKRAGVSLHLCVILNFDNLGWEIKTQDIEN